MNKRELIGKFLDDNDSRAIHSDIQLLIDYILESERDDFEENNGDDSHIYAVARRLCDSFQHYVIPEDALANL